MRRAVVHYRAEARCVMPPPELVNPVERWFPFNCDVRQEADE